MALPPPWRHHVVSDVVACLGQFRGKPVADDERSTPGSTRRRRTRGSCRERPSGPAPRAGPQRIRRSPPAGGSACSSPGRPPRERLFITGTAAGGAPVHHRDGRSRRRDRACRRLRPRACPGGRSTHPASPASRQAERPLRLPRKIRPLRNIRATGVARILPGSRILRENGTVEAERTKPSPAARHDAHGPGLAAHRSPKRGSFQLCPQVPGPPTGNRSHRGPVIAAGAIRGPRYRSKLRYISRRWPTAATVTTRAPSSTQ